MTQTRQLLFGRFRLDPDNARLWHEAQVIPLPPKAFATLRYLAEHPGRLVTKGELLEAVWGHCFVSDSALKVCMGEIRKALGDDPKAPRFIETAPGGGIGLSPRSPPPQRPSQEGIRSSPPSVPPRPGTLGWGGPAPDAHSHHITHPSPKQSP